MKEKDNNYLEIEEAINKLKLEIKEYEKELYNLIEKLCLKNEN